MLFHVVGHQPAQLLPVDRAYGQFVGVLALDTRGFVPAQVTAPALHSHYFTAPGNMEAGFGALMSL
jgi:hypothetical protein